MKRLLGVVLLAAAASVSCGAPDAAAPPTAAATTASAPVTALAAQPVPVRVEVPSIGAAGDLVGLGVDENGGTAEPPVEQPKLGSWYNLGPKPGEHGPAVILGHVNGHGQAGLFSRLAEMQVGDRATVFREDGSSVQFEAYRTASIEKTDFPTNDVYGDTEGAELRLITCGGDYDPANRRYLSNVIVFLKLV